MTDSKDVIAAKGVTKVYSDNGVPVHALRGIEFEVTSVDRQRIDKVTIRGLESLEVQNEERAGPRKE